MNTELIKKYKKEFDYWVNGGKILMHYGNKWIPVALDAKWEFFISDLEEMRSFGYVIADEYVEFRKALAEGKTIEYYTIVNYKYPITRMDELEVLIKANHSGKYIFRIKPEEPEFKVGDWITVNGPTGTFTECISGIANNTYTLSGTNICYRSQASKWEPKEDEVCIFWDNHSAGAFIDKFKYLSNNGKYHTERSFWNTCMPFEGKLPPHMKDNK